MLGDSGTRAMLPIPIAGHGHDGSGAPGDSRIEFVPLSSVARIRLEEGPNQVSRENGKRVIAVTAEARFCHSRIAYASEPAGPLKNAA